MDYRNNSEKCLERAEAELATNDEGRIIYAALELRMALENLVYKKATYFQEELSQDVLRTWQPKKLLEHLIELDPLVDKPLNISVGIEEVCGESANKMKFMGIDRNISLREIKKYYHRIGSFLHAPTVEQIKAGQVADSNKIRERCTEVVEILKQVFSSPIFNSDFKTLSSIECKGCGNKIVRRIHPKKNTVIAHCIHCKASYELTQTNEKSIKWSPMRREIDCPNESCSQKTLLWEKQVELDNHWTCDGCGSQNILSLSVTIKPPES